MKKKNIFAAIALIFSVLTFLFAYTIDTFLPTFSQNIGELKWILVGIGAGVMGYSSSVLLTSIMYKKDPTLAKQAKINENDERFLMIRKTATYYTWFVTLFSLMAMTLTFTIMNLSVAAWFAIGALLLHIVSTCIFIMRLDKKM